MKQKPNELISGGYQIQDSLNHQQLIPFIRLYLKKPTVSSRLYTFSNVLFFLLLVAYFAFNWQKDSFQFEKGLSYTSFGIVFAFLLIPLHEYIHVLAYKWVGAENTSYDVNLKKFYFLAVADQFVASRKEFKIVAWAPFTVISSILLLSLFFTNPLWTFSVLGTLLTHAAFCSGDFGLLSYFDFHSDKTIVTYDDKANKISYFLVK